MIQPSSQWALPQCCAMLRIQVMEESWLHTYLQGSQHYWIRKGRQQTWLQTESKSGKSNEDQQWTETRGRWKGRNNGKKLRQYQINKWLQFNQIIRICMDMISNYLGIERTWSELERPQIHMKPDLQWQHGLVWKARGSAGNELTKTQNKHPSYALGLKR